MDEVAQPKSSTTTIKLLDPVQFGEELIEELLIKPTARACKDFSLPMSAEGSLVYQPYALAAVGVKMAGRPPALLDKMSVRDMNTLGLAVLSFFG